MTVHNLDRFFDENSSEEGKRTHDRRQHALVVERNDRQVVDLGQKETFYNV